VHVRGESNLANSKLENKKNENELNNDGNCVELLTKIRVRSKSPFDDTRDQKLSNLLYDIDIDDDDLNNS